MGLFDSLRKKVSGQSKKVELAYKKHNVDSSNNKQHEQQTIITKHSAIDAALEKLAESAKDYKYIPPNTIGSLSSPEQVPLNFTCDNCGQNTNIMIDDQGGKEQLIILDYRAVARMFTKIGYPAKLKCYCNPTSGCTQ